MKISLNWLSDHVDVADLDPAVLAERLTLATAEVEQVETIENAAAAVVVGQVVQLEPLAGAGGDTAQVATVETGSGRFRTVTTAPDVRPGMKAPFAAPDTKLPGGLVTVQAIAGTLSEGMLCSAADIGLGSAHEGLLVCPEDARPGSPLSTWIPPRDILLDIDNKSLTHRPDLWGHYGFARELAAIFERPLRPLPLAATASFDDLPPFKLRDDAEADCPCFSCLALDIDRNGPSPLLLQARLHVLSQRSFNILVDATNYVALELGQPMHVYDREVVPEIRVAAMGRAGQFKSLDGQLLSIHPDDLMIWNHHEPIGLAGIIGGLGSRVGPETSSVLLESANFRASRVRQTSVRLGLRTDASQRFEKNQPPANTVVAIARMVRLLEDAGASPVAVSRLTVAGDLANRPRRITMPASYISERAGADIPPQRVTGILESLGFGAAVVGDRLEVDVPPYRSAQDISLPADVLEEVLRVHGYAAIPPRPPAALLASTPFPQPVRREHKARRVLSQAHRYTEVESYLWFDDRWLAQIGYRPVATLRLRNAVAPEKARLRDSLLPNLLRVAAENLQHREAFRIFEIGRVLLPGRHGPMSANPETHQEVPRLSGLSIQLARGSELEDHYGQVKGAVEDIGRAVAGQVVRAEPADWSEDDPPWCTPGLLARLRLGQRVVGSMGMLAGPVLDLVAPQRQLIWFDLALDELDGPLYPAVRYQPLPAHPMSQQDFSLLWRESETYDGLRALLDRFHHPLVQRREFLFRYRGSGLEPGVASYTFRYWLQRPDATLSTEDLERFRAEFLSFLEEHGVGLR
jgi:phenylalanyl-tRNA synthetase beta chain